MYIDTGRTLCNVYQLLLFDKIKKITITDFSGLLLYENKCAAACNDTKIGGLSDVPGFRYIFLERIKFNLYLLYRFQVY